MVNIKMSDSILHLTVLSKRSPSIFTDEEKRSHLRKETQGAMVCDTTHLCVLHDSFMCVTQHIHTCQLSSCRTGYNLCMPMPTYIHVCVSHVCHNVCMMPTCIHVCVCMRTPTYTQVCVSRTCMWASPCIHVCMQMPSYMCVYIHVDVHTCSYLHMYAHAYTRVRACAYISIKHKHTTRNENVVITGWISHLRDRVHLVITCKLLGEHLIIIAIPCFPIVFN
mmetsp:Transcript_37740/g.60852  ORF Transcript_37740/g.60852 Transcript_37740/m.60852 type:complete len:222 (+) Transcript_37740:365-1030(+)